LHIDDLKKGESEKIDDHLSVKRSLDSAEHTVPLTALRPPNEEHILTLMESMAFSRVEAINLLHQYSDDLDAIFQTLLS
jgi:hypothetical protein